VRAKSILVLALILAGCGSTPKPAEPPRLRAALEAESDGARRYSRGDFSMAERRFDEAMRLFASIDDASGRTRNLLHLARTRLARGHAEAALDLLNAADPGAGPGPALDALLLKAQAQLALARDADAQQSLVAAADRCGAACPQAASLHLLQARAALAGKRPQEALAHADSALKLLRDSGEAIETANAWRMIAAARLAAGDAAGALPAAEAALGIDRRLALPEKIASDWLLIGDIRRKVMRSGIHSDGAGDTAAAYRRALEVANAARLGDIAASATQALADLGKTGVPAR
jgi:tetratricopeptide (TPR) repeat protein